MWMVVLLGASREISILMLLMILLSFLLHSLLLTSVIPHPLSSPPFSYQSTSTPVGSCTFNGRWRWRWGDRRARGHEERKFSSFSLGPFTGSHLPPRWGPRILILAHSVVSSLILRTPPGSQPAPPCFPSPRHGVTPQSQIPSEPGVRQQVEKGWDPTEWPGLQDRKDVWRPKLDTIPIKTLCPQSSPLGTILTR